MKVKAEFPAIFQKLFQPNRYKILYGGRAGMKSWACARALLIQASNRPLRILCAREFQKSIKDSVHKLLTDQIKLLQLDSFFEITQSSIRGKNGSEFFFEGLKHNTQQIKSYEGVDRVWVEEAVTVSKASWDFLIPTIRKEKSEIWISFNPELDTDDTYIRYVINPPENSTIIKTSWRDNIWLSDVSKRDMLECKNKDDVNYQTIWEGHCRSAVEGAIYEKEIRQAETENRITSIPYKSTCTVMTFWDIGFRDMTSIWFVQKAGFEYHFIDFYQNCRQNIGHYIKMLQEKGYIYDTDYLPHDARAKELGTGKSIEETMRGLGRKISIAPMLSIADGIDAVRMIFNACWFDKTKCHDGLQALRRYRYDADRYSKNPLHDENSHTADAFRMFAVTPNVQWNILIEKKGFSQYGHNKILAEFNPYSEQQLAM